MSTAHDRSRGSVRLAYEFEYIDQDQPRLGRRRSSVGALRGHHDEVYTVNRVHRWRGTFGITDRLSADLQLPFVNRSHQHVHHHRGTPLLEAWDFSGMGDFSTQLRYAFWWPEASSKPMLSAILGAKFPTGKTQITNDDGDDAEPTVTPGTGSYDIIMGFASRKVINVPMPFGAHGQAPIFLTATYQHNGRGIDDYRIGDLLLVNVGTEYPLWRRFSALAQLNTKVAARDDQGHTSEEIGKTGGEYLYLSPGVLLKLGHGFESSTLIQFPIYQRVNQLQVTSDWNLVTSLSWRFRISE